MKTLLKGMIMALLFLYSGSNVGYQRIGEKKQPGANNKMITDWEIQNVVGAKSLIERTFSATEISGAPRKVRLETKFGHKYNKQGYEIETDYYKSDGSLA